MRTEIVPDMDEATYRAHPGVSVSELKTLREGIPASARSYREQKKEPTPAMIFGTLAHKAILEPELFPGCFHLAPEDYDGRTKAGKEWAAAHADKPVLKRDGELSLATIQAMVHSIHEMPEARRIFAWRGANEASIFAPHKETGLQIKGRCDRLSEDDDGRPVVVDLKTTDDPCGFERVAASLGYYLQDAFYTKLLQAHGSDPLFVFIAVGNRAPFGVRVGVLDEESKRRGTAEVERLLALYAKCAESGEWPAYRVNDAGKRVGMEQFKLPRWIHLQHETP